MLCSRRAMDFGSPVDPDVHSTSSESGSTSKASCRERSKLDQSTRRGALTAPSADRTTPSIASDAPASSIVRGASTGVLRAAQQPSSAAVNSNVSSRSIAQRVPPASATRAATCEAATRSSGQRRSRPSRPKLTTCSVSARSAADSAPVWLMGPGSVGRSRWPSPICVGAHLRWAASTRARTSHSPPNIAPIMR